MTVLRLSILAGGALLLSACATNSGVLNTPAIQEFSGKPEQSALIMEIDGVEGCERTNLLMRSESGESLNLNLRSGRRPIPTFHLVEPGSYKFTYGSCFGSQYSIPNFADLNIWFGPIQVAKGEVVYPGKLILDKQEVKIRREGLDAVVNTLNLKPNKKRNFATYRFEDFSETLPERIGDEGYQISDKIIYRPPLAVLDPKEFQLAIERAYAPMEDGRKPTESEVSARFADEIKTALSRSLATMKDRNAP